MFSFFRRAKKENNGGKSRKSPVLQTHQNHDNRDVLASVIVKVQENLEETSASSSTISLPNPVTNQPESGLPPKLNVSEVNTVEKNDSEAPPTSTNMSEARRYVPEFPKDIRIGGGASVKPCGHGTTAILPSVPLTLGKRENPNTPSTSPKLETKKFARIAPLERQNSNETSDKHETPLQAPFLANQHHGSNEHALQDDEKKNLINQEAKFQSQLNDLSKLLSIRDAEANKLRFQMEELQRDVFAKTAGMDRLEAELQAAHKECDFLRQRVKHLESDLSDYREKNRDISKELNDKSETQTSFENHTNAKILELENVIKNLEAKIVSLESELEELKQEKIQLEEHRAVLLAERDEQKKKVEEILEQATQQKQEIEKKWKSDFEQHRTVNILKEQQLLDDFEWKLREVQQTCKKRIEDKDKSIKERLEEAYKEAERKMQEAEMMMTQVETVKSYQLEIEQLKGLTVEQENALKEMAEQQDQMKQAEESLRTETKRLRNLIEMEKENLQHMQRRHHQEIVDKERVLKQTLQQKRTEIAMYWEERLLHECGRLKMELEQMHNEEKHYAMETVRRDKDEEFQKVQQEWENKLTENLKEIANLKRLLHEKDDYYREEIIRSQSNTDRDILELRRLMDKIDMCHHDRFEKLVQNHEAELEQIHEETEQRIKTIETTWQNQMITLRNNLDLLKQQMEEESQEKLESLIQQHRSELDTQWENLLSQKSEAVQLVEEEYITKYKTLEGQFLTQQKSHECREIELLKAIDSLKNELASKQSALDDLQNNVDVLEGGIQVLNQEIAQQNEQISKNKKEADHKIRGLQETISKNQDQHDKEQETTRLKLMSVQKQSQETIDHLQRKCTCLTKLFEEVRLRYERRESRQEDLNIISDLRQVIAEQEKDLACLNEEKRYFQMRLMTLESRLDDGNSGDEQFEDAEQKEMYQQHPPPAYPNFGSQTSLSIPETIPEGDE